MSTIKIRRGPESTIPTLNVGEFGYTTDTEKLYLGTGVSNILISVNGVAPDSSKLGGVMPSKFLRNDVAGQTVQGLNIYGGGEGGEIVLTGNDPDAYVHIDNYYGVCRVFTPGEFVISFPQVSGTVYTSGNDGHLSGLDADKLDGKEASDFADVNHNHDSSYVNVTGDTMTGALDVASGGIGIGSSRRVNNNCVEWYGGTSSGIFSTQDGTGRLQLKWNSTYGSAEKYLVSNEAAGRIIFNPPGGASDVFKIDYAGSGTANNSIPWTTLLSVGSSNLTYKGYNILHSGNDGHLSGLDADKLDGYHLWVGTQSSYDAISTPDSSTVYIIKG